jgi:hypothetical protein
VEHDRRYCEIAIVDVSNHRSTIGVIFDVDLAESDSGAGELGLEPYAVATPTGGEDGRQACGRQIHSHDMFNQNVGGAISLRCIAFVTLGSVVVNALFHRYGRRLAVLCGPGA